MKKSEETRGCCYCLLRRITSCAGVRPAIKAELSPLRRPEVSRLPTSIKADNAKNLPLPPGIRMDHSLEMILPEGCDERDGIQSKKRTKLYSGYALRPYPVMRNNCAVDYGKKAAIKLRREATITDQEDAFLLRLIEGYCTSAGSSRTENLPPQLIVADDEKLFVEEIVGDEVVVREKSLVDTVYALKDQIIEMQKEIQKMNKTIDKEQKARRRLEEMVRRRVRSPSVSVAH
ncbi:hypothetical protein AB6A40_000052 [Gnathostoma spinigerum]|uniref:Rho guanine nucleotide exchange factor 6/7 coiled-coil domain-containing protein n=1 Tax=Gnathostoma spinigerum TaxID=75299 RepID=A0ABD6E1D9_9BILA